MTVVTALLAYLMLSCKAVTLLTLIARTAEF